MHGRSGLLRGLALPGRSDLAALWLLTISLVEAGQLVPRQEALCVKFVGISLISACLRLVVPHERQNGPLEVFVAGRMQVDRQLRNGSPIVDLVVGLDGSLERGLCLSGQVDLMELN